MEFVLTTIERRRLLLPVPFGLLKLQAAFLQFLPKPPITPDQVELLSATTSCPMTPGATAARSKALASCPSSMAAVVPSYLWRFRKTGQFSPHTA